jgi:hypothetical protein
MSGYIAGFVTREQAGLRKPKSVSRNIAPKGSVIHWGGPKVDIKSHADCAGVWRSWQRYHMDTKGWVDVAYSTGFCPHGYVFAGRGKGVRTAANGTNAANRSRYAHVWLGGSGNRLTEEAIAAMWWLHENFGGGAIEPHSKYRSTSCCGDALRNAIKAGSSATKPQTSTPRSEDETMKLNDTGNAVKFFQRALLAFGAPRKDAEKLPNGKTWGDARRYGADGDYGSTTEAMVRAYQSAAGVEVTGAIGGVTAALLAEYITDRGATGGMTVKHNHPVTGRLAIVGSTDLGRELAGHLSISGSLSTGSGG